MYYFFEVLCKYYTFTLLNPVSNNNKLFTEKSVKEKVHDDILDERIRPPFDPDKMRSLNKLADLSNLGHHLQETRCLTIDSMVA